MNVVAGTLTEAIAKNAWHGCQLVYATSRKLNKPVAASYRTGLPVAVAMSQANTGPESKQDTPVATAVRAARNTLHVLHKHDTVVISHGVDTATATYLTDEATLCAAVVAPSFEGHALRIFKNKKPRLALVTVPVDYVFPAEPDTVTYFDVSFPRAQAPEQKTETSSVRPDVVLAECVAAVLPKPGLVAVHQGATVCCVHGTHCPPRQIIRFAQSVARHVFKLRDPQVQKLVFKRMTKPAEKIRQRNEYVDHKHQKQKFEKAPTPFQENTVSVPRMAWATNFKLGSALKQELELPTLSSASSSSAKSRAQSGRIAKT